MIETSIAVREVASQMKGLTPQSRHRMSKELAEELIQEMGDSAYLFCVEKLQRGAHPLLWRDVLTWLDELNKGESNDHI